MSLKDDPVSQTDLTVGLGRVMVVLSYRWPSAHLENKITLP